LTTIWDKVWESADRAAIRARQAELLREQLKYVYDRLPYYRQKMNEHNLSPASIRSLDDLRLLPFTTKDDFTQNYPYGTFAVPRNRVVRVHGSSGTTTGKPSIAGYTQGDLDIWAELVARLATAAGVATGDIAQICFGYGLFTGGFGLHAGLERIGALVLPISSGNTQRQLQFIRDFGTTAIVGTPTYALHIAEVAAETGFPISQMNLRWGLFGGEPWSESARQEIDRRLGITATDNYGLSEVMGPGVSYECLTRNGLHIAEDHFIPEVIDPDTSEPLPEGAVGELVFTSLTKEATPVIRYRTRDLASLDYSPCPCGRTLVRMSRVRGRTDDMLIVRGVNIFPSQIEEALLAVEHTQPHYQIILYKNGALDEIEVHVEVVEEIFDDEMKRMKSVEEEICEKLRAITGIACRVKLVEPKTIERFTGKAKRVIDRRNKT
jgi:phenylacetate-CoA ligase